MDLVLIFYTIFILGPITEIKNDVMLIHAKTIVNNNKYLIKYNFIEILSVLHLPVKQLKTYWFIYIFSLDAYINDAVVIEKHGYNNNKQNNTPFSSNSLYK